MNAGLSPSLAIVIADIPGTFDAKPDTALLLGRKQHSFAASIAIEFRQRCSQWLHTSLLFRDGEGALRILTLLADAVVTCDGPHPEGEPCIHRLHVCYCYYYSSI